MKNYIKVYIVLISMFILSCQDDISDLNIDPNTSPIANDAQVLTSAIGYLGYVVDVDLNFGSFLWAQYYTWGIGVSLGNQERFVAEPDDYDGYWQRAYANVLADLNYLSKSESNAYQGVALILKAYVFQGLVDQFGTVPYTEAISGEISDGGILTPAFDDGASIYADLIVKIQEAKGILATASGDIGTDDLIYGGDLTSWIKFANSLELRLLMRTSEVSPNAAAVTDLISSGTFVESVGDMPAIPFQDVIGDQNPMFARMSWGVGDFYFASNATLNLLESLGDPRISSFYSLATTGDEAGTYFGIDQGTIDDEPFTNPPTNYSGSSSYAVDAGNDVLLMSPWEVWFLRAEAAARYGTADDETAAFTTAVTENFSYAGASGASAYITSLGYAVSSSLDDKLDLIGVQKYISMNGTQENEGWIEAKRFDREASRLFTDGIWQTPPLSVLSDGDFPASFLYPASERSFNPDNSPAQKVLTEKVFWDN